MNYQIALYYNVNYSDNQNDDIKIITSRFNIMQSKSIIQTNKIISRIVNRTNNTTKYQVSGWHQYKEISRKLKELNIEHELIFDNHLTRKVVYLIEHYNEYPLYFHKKVQIMYIRCLN